MPYRDPESRARWHAQRRATLDAMKLERGCVDCGYNAHPAALEFDHRDPADKDPLLVGGRTISSQLQRRWSWVLAEVAKCDVRCANCHAIRSVAEGHHLLGREQLAAGPDPQLVLGI